MKTLGQLVWEARARRKWSLREVSRKVMGVSPALLSLIERDIHRPPAETIIHLAGLFRADIDRWCGAAGRLTPYSVACFAALATKSPESFRFLRDLVSKGKSELVHPFRFGKSGAEATLDYPSPEIQKAVRSAYATGAKASHHAEPYPTTANWRRSGGRCACWRMAKRKADEQWTTCSTG